MSNFSDTMLLKDKFMNCKARETQVALSAHWWRHTTLPHSPNGTADLFHCNLVIPLEIMGDDNAQHLEEGHFLNYPLWEDRKQNSYM